MVKFVAIGVAIFVLAFGIVVVTQSQDLAALVAAFRADPLMAKVAWTAIVLVPLVLLPCAVWLGDTLLRQRTAAKALELRLDGVRRDVKELVKSQFGAEAAVHHLARTDPEQAVSEMQQRLTEAEHVLHVQQSRNEFGNIQARVDALRVQQDVLQQRLAPVLDQRRLIERMFMDLDSRQNDIERTLAEIATGDDAVALEIRLKNLVEFVRKSHEHCDEIERASKTISGLKEGYAELRTRIAPFAAAQDGVTSRVEELTEERDLLAEDIESLQRTHRGPLAEHVHNLTEDKKKLDDSVANLNVQFSKLASLRKDIDGLFVSFDRALKLLALTPDEDNTADVEARVEEISAFIGTTQSHVEDIERRLAMFGQLRNKLIDLQSRIVPLEADENGVAGMIGSVRDIRDKLTAKISRLEHGDDGDLAARVKALTETKRDLEDRVANLTEQFSKLATIRKDIAGLFDRLSDTVTVTTSTN